MSISDFDKLRADLSDFNFEFKIFENLQDYKRLTLALPSTHLEDYLFIL